MASTYTLSRPILQELQSRSNTQGTLRPPPGESHTAYLDHSLAILGSEILSQNKQLDTAFAQQCDYVRNANQEAYRGQIQRDGTIIEKLNDLDRVYSEWFQKIDERFQQTVERFQQIDNTQGARQRNAIKVRPHYTIERVPHVQHGIARWADEEIHPKTVKIFWQMGHQRKQRMNLVHLLQFYGDRTLCVPPTDAIPNFHDDDDDEEDEKELDTIKDVMRNQKACLGVLASHLGLDFDRIEKEAEKVTGYQQRARLIRPTSERRGQEDEPDQNRPRTKARIQAQADRTDQDGRIQTQVRATQEQSSGTSITSPRSNASGPHLGAHPSSSTSGISDSLATQRLSHGSDDDAS